MALSGTNNTIELLERLLKILKEENVLNRSSDEPVARFLQPTELQAKLLLSLNDGPAGDKEIERAIRQIIRYSVWTFSPHFHNQLYAGVDEYGLAGSWLTDVFNTSQYTYETAPVFTLLERELIKRLLDLVRYPTMPGGDGIMSPGGSISNMYGMVLARYKMLPEVKKKGLSGIAPLACFTSESSHYSIMKGAHWLGLGTDNVHKVKTDSLGRMDPHDLRRALKDAKGQGQIPFFVNATCGTTVLGAFDPLPEIAEICQAHEIWLHVDACLGGTLLFSEEYRHKLQGIELSNSISFNPHKMLGAPFQCSFFLVKEDNLLYAANSARAEYLFQPNKIYPIIWDMGDKSIQCGRKVDGMKFWLMWKARGTLGLQRSVNQAMHCAKYFLKLIKGTDGFRLVLPEFECTNICFWYIPPSMRDKKETTIWWQKLYQVTVRIRELTTLEGSLMISYVSLPEKNYGNFFRMVVNCQPPPTESAMEFIVQQIDRFGRNM